MRAERRFPHAVIGDRGGAAALLAQLLGGEPAQLAELLVVHERVHRHVAHELESAGLRSAGAHETGHLGVVARRAHVERRAERLEFGRELRGRTRSGALGHQARGERRDAGQRILLGAAAGGHEQLDLDERQASVPQDGDAQPVGKHANGGNRQHRRRERTAGTAGRAGGGAVERAGAAAHADVADASARTNSMGARFIGRPPLAEPARRSPATPRSARAARRAAGRRVSAGRAPRAGGRPPTGRR